MRSAAAKRIKTLRNDSLLRAAFEEDDDADETANRRLIFYTSVNVTSRFSWGERSMLRKLALLET